MRFFGFVVALVLTFLTTVVLSAPLTTSDVSARDITYNTETARSLEGLELEARSPEYEGDLFARDAIVTGIAEQLLKRDPNPSPEPNHLNYPRIHLRRKRG
ncbi:hypothetical protein ABKN59_005341 [Abortiporus biennis]